MKNKTLTQILKLIHNNRHFPCKEIPHQELQIELNVVSDTLCIALIKTLDLQSLSLFFPLEIKNSHHQINWLHPDWLELVGIKGVNWLFLNDSSHPIIHNNTQLIKFFPNPQEESLRRELEFCSYLNNHPRVILPSQPLVYKDQIIGLVYSYQKGISLWEQLTQKNRTEIFTLTGQATQILVDIHAKLPQSAVHHFLPSHSFSEILTDYNVQWDSISYPIQISHDDLHLGQFICHNQELYCLDFGGCPIEDKWWANPSCLEKDYASLLRSVDYRLQCNQDSPLKAEEIIHYCHKWKLNPTLFGLCYLARLQYEIEYESKYRPNFKEIPMNGLNAWIEFAKMI